MILEGSTGEIQRKKGGEGVIRVVASFEHHAANFHFNFNPAFDD